MRSLPLRIFSAAVAVVILWAVSYFFKSTGLIVFGAFVCGVGTYEYQRLAFAQLSPPLVLRFLFIIFSLLLMVISLLFTDRALPAGASLITLYFVALLWVSRNAIENPRLLSLFSASALGFIYCSLLPIFALKLLLISHGYQWFIFLLTVVFFGDVFAYFGGNFWGKEKIMIAVSPSKTVAGSISGVVGSLVAALLMWRLGLGDIPLVFLLSLAAISSALAQSGDLFESLIKRVADVKDSGRIMPGHGGVLDRLDGIYFAAPLIYTAAVFLNS